MNRLTLPLALLSLLLLSASPALADKKKKKGKDKRPTVAISYFSANTADPELAPLGKGLADMLLTDLGHVQTIRLVERGRLEDLVGELKLSQTKVIDKKTALKMGKLLSAKLIMTGSLVVAGKTLRIDARVIEVSTGNVLGSDKVDGPRDDFFALEKDLVDLIVRTLELKLSGKERSALRRNQTQSFAAFQAYAQGLDAEDKGDKTRAAELFKKALTADPNYRSAKNATERVAAIMGKLDKERDSDQLKALRKLDPKSPQFSAQVNQILMTVDEAVPGQLERKIRLLRWLVEDNRVPTSAVSAPEIFQLIGLASRQLINPTAWKHFPGLCEYMLIHAPKAHMQQQLVQRNCRPWLQQIVKWKPNAAVYQKSWDDSRKSPGDDATKAHYQQEKAILSLFALCAKKATKK